MSRINDLIQTLNLLPHREGGHFREVFASTHSVAPNDDRGERPALTSIYFLLGKGEHSSWHVLRSDEVWHHYEGDPLELLVVDPDRLELTTLVLGSMVDGGQLVHVVPAGHWQAARTLGDYTLVSCTVGPGFVFEDFQLLRDDADASSRLLERLERMADLL